MSKNKPRPAAVTTSSSSDTGISIDDKPVLLRFLKPADLVEVQRLCEEWFPVQYPDTWYQDITSNSRFYSLAAEFDGQIIGLVVAEIRVKGNCNREEQGILDSVFPQTVKVVYILSLGVVKDYRCNGIASLMLDDLLTHVTDSSQHDCKAVYLHVLSTNVTAIRFYERRNFTQHDFLPYYYNIKGIPRDGYCYVTYINGGYAPWSFIDYVKSVTVSVGKLQPCSYPRRMLQGVGNWIRRLLPQLSNHCQSCLPTGAPADTT